MFMPRQPPKVIVHKLIYAMGERKRGKTQVILKFGYFHFSIYGLKSNLSINGHNFVNTFQRITDYFSVN
jgi:hypothetical protein